MTELSRQDGHVPTQRILRGPSESLRGRGAPSPLGAVRRAIPAVAVLLLMTMGVYLVAPVAPTAVGPAVASLLGHAPSGATRASSPHLAVVPTMPAATPAANNSNFNPFCFPLNATLCISVTAPNTPDIIPYSGNHNAPYMPNATDNITLYLKSEYNLVPPGPVQTSGVKSPIALNLSGTLWDGDLYMCQCDATVYHANAAPWWTAPAAVQGVNKTYPYWYLIQIQPRNGFGQPQFFSGESISWYIYIVTYDAKHTSYSGQQVGPTFTYRLAGAWPFSPWPGSVQYAGPNASTADLNLRWSPLVPNWNDSLAVTIQLTRAAVTNRTLIGFPPTAITPYVRLTEFWPNGTVMVANATYRFPIVPGAPGASILNVTLPPTLTQVAGSKIVFQVTAQDSARYETNTLALPPVTIFVNGNGSFPTGVFENDLVLNTSINGHPVNISTVSQSTRTVIGPGVNLTLTLTTRSLSTSIQSAQVQYTFYYGPLAETTHTVLPMDRLNSTAFRGTIPSMPLGSIINFTVSALDYSHHLDLSNPAYTYQTQSLSEWVTVIPSNETFFFIYVFNNQTQSYLSGAQVQISESFAVGYNTLSATRFGVAYPNATGNDFLPLLVPANQTYNISVTPNPGTSVVSAGHVVTVQVFIGSQGAVAREHRTLAKGTDYVVLQEGNSIYFWLNGTLSSTIVSPNQGSGGLTLLAGVVGLAAAAVVSFVVWTWFREVQARRKAEEKRVTL